MVQTGDGHWIGVPLQCFDVCCRAVAGRGVVHALCGDIATADRETQARTLLVHLLLLGDKDQLAKVGFALDFFFLQLLLANGGEEEVEVGEEVFIRDP